MDYEARYHAARYRRDARTQLLLRHNGGPVVDSYTLSRVRAPNKTHGILFDPHDLDRTVTNGDES